MQGLFGYSTGTIKNVGVANSEIAGGNNVGAIVGQNNSGTVSNCWNSGAVSGQREVGGIVGNNNNPGVTAGGTVRNCWNSGTVSASNINCGGIAGYNGGSTVSNCWNSGTVSAMGSLFGASNAGGIVGPNASTGTDSNRTGKVINNYNTGAVSGSGFQVGGVVGSNNTNSIVSYCYYLTSRAKDGQNKVQSGIGTGTINTAGTDTDGTTNAFTGTGASCVLSNTIAYNITDSAGTSSKSIAAGARLVTALDTWVASETYNTWTMTGSTTNYPIFGALWANTYTVTYNGNTSIGGTVPTGATAYASGATVTVLGNTGSLVKTNSTFAGWNTAADGNGIDYAPAATFAISANTTLYAKWTAKTAVSITETAQTFTYDGAAKTFAISGTPITNYTITYNQGAGNVTPNNVGTYDVVITRAEDATYASYSKTITSGLVITPATITVTPNSSLTKVYGTADPTFTYTYGGAVAAETPEFTGALSRVMGSDVGDYAITLGTLALADNSPFKASNYTLVLSGTTVNFKISIPKPTATTGAAGSVTSTGATLNGTVNANNASTMVTFEYGLTSAYGSTATADQSPVAGTAGTAVSRAITGLTPNTTYHYRVVVVNAAGTTNGLDQTFTTVAANPAKAITAFNFNTLTPNVTGIVNKGAKTIALTVPYGTDITALVPTITHTGASISPNTGVAKNFTNPVTYTVTAADSSTQAYIVTVTTSALPTESGAAPTTPSTAPSTVVEVNGQKQDAGTSNTQTTGGQSVTTITVDETKLDKILESSGDKPTVTLPSTGSDVTVGELSGQTVKNMAQKEAILEIKTETATYALPASEINIDTVSQQLGLQVELKDIKVSVTIAEPSADTVKVVEDTANKGNYQLVVKPVEFTITCTSGDNTVEVSRFNGYVERTIAIPDGIDPSRVTTGIVLNADGTFSHVPTTIVKIDGKYYAKINSLTNSTYTVIYNPIEFTDVASHWANTAINDMGSRMVVTGIGNSAYEPDRSITRAEFATIVVRALGLQRGTTESAFGDVTITDWFNGYVETATAYSLITGYDSASYAPNDAISREQAMAIIARAMKLTGLSVSLTDSEVSELLAKYTDGAEVSDYAKTSAAICLKTGVLIGTSATTLSPKADVTRAEVAVMVQRLLQKSGLI